MDNYEFCAAFAVSAVPSGGRMLDYGCGAGQIVKRARALGIDAYGCDVFYEGGSHESEIAADDMGSVILRMDGDHIPFDDDTFDFVVSNQVMEHVENLDKVVAEIARVLKPSGVVLSLFPDRGVWREGHCGVPFLHRFPKGSRPRVYYAEAMRRLGLGHHKGDKTPRQWAEDFCTWLDKWTFYRPYREIAETFKHHLSPPEHLEAEWIVARDPRFSAIPCAARAWIARKAGHLVFLSRKPLGEVDPALANVRPCIGERPTARRLDVLEN